MDQHAGVDYLVLLCECVISILIRKLMIVDAVEVWNQMSKGNRSGLLAGHGMGPALPIYLSLKVWSNHLRATLE